MSRKKKILYLMHVDWNWIKQRPHFLAEALAEYFQVDVFYGRSFHSGKNLTRNAKAADMTVKPFVRLPMFLNKTKWIKKIAGFVNRVLIGGKIGEYDIVWFCHPVFFDDIAPALKPGQTVVYDCMDDVLEFPSVKKDPALRAVLAVLEKGLIGRSAKVICSAENLKKKLTARYGNAEKYVLVHNGMNLQAGAYSREKRLDPKITEAMGTSDRKLTYIGTISEWMDWNLVLSSLKENGNITYFFFGPVAPGVAVPVHPKIIPLGPVAHDQILHIMKVSDLLIMPFRLTELILSVDPVKLYEYIYSGVPSLALGYPETNKFGGYVHLYHDKKEYLSAVKRASAGNLKPKQNAAACRNFVKKHGWEQRAGDLMKVLKQIDGRESRR